MRSFFECFERVNQPPIEPQLNKRDRTTDTGFCKAKTVKPKGLERSESRQQECRKFDRRTSIRNGGARRDRTDDLKLAKLPLSQLSYGPGDLLRSDDLSRSQCPIFMVGLGGLEPPTSRLSSARSNQLSYKPESLSTGHKPVRAGPSEPAHSTRKRNEDGDIPQMPCATTQGRCF